ELNTDLYPPALETLRTIIRTSTSSVTSVPKPLKFLRPHYPGLQELSETWPTYENKVRGKPFCMTLAYHYAESIRRYYHRTLRYRLLSASLLPPTSKISEPGSWGHEYVRHLAAELGEEYTIRQEGEEEFPLLAPEADSDSPKSKPAPVPGTIEDLHNLGLECATFFLGLNAEPDAVDLFVELEIVDWIASLVDTNTFGRVCAYMDRCVTLLPPPDDVTFLRTIHKIYLQFSKFPEALGKQLTFLLARAQIPIEWLKASALEDADAKEEFPEDILDCLSNTQLSRHFKEFGKEVIVADPKNLEDIYKSYLETTRSGLSANVDSACANLAGTFVNAFVNAGFGNDKLMVYKNKDHGMMSAAASLGLGLLWDTDVCLSQIDIYTHFPEEWIKGGVRAEADAALTLLAEHVESQSAPLKIAAIMGLGVAYAGSHREDLLTLLLPAVADDGVSMEIAALSAFALGFVFVGSGNGEIMTLSTILQTLMERGLQDASDATLETLKAIWHPISRQAQILVEVCSFVATGDVLRVQRLLHLCGEHLDALKEKEQAESVEGKKDEDKDEKKEDKKPDDTLQSFAVLGITMITMGEDIVGDPIILKSVLLVLGLISASNPQLPVLDTLSKYSHDHDLVVALNAIFAMGLVGAGTNNARLAQMLRQLAGYYYKELDCLFMVRIVQGHDPFFSDGNIMSRLAIVGLLATIMAFTDAKAFALDKYHWMLYFLVTAMYPRFLITLDEDLESKPVTVRAVDVVRQAGKPRTISGFQTHQTPVRLGTTERAELATEEFIPYEHVLEGFKEDTMQMEVYYMPLYVKIWKTG
ncbi:hypothetical protein F4604DRAFT_1809232, partial [Suillus subluteus]